MKCQIDEVRRAEHFRVDGDSLRCEARTQVGQRLVDAVRDFERSRTVRSVNYQYHAGFSSDGSGTDGRRWSFRYSCNVSERQRHVGTVVMDENCAGELRGCDRLPLRLQNDSLIGSIDKTSPANSCSPSRGGDHLLCAYSVLNEPLGIELELKLVDFASINLHSGNAAHRL